VAQKSGQSAQLASKVHDIYASTTRPQDADLGFARQELRALFDVRLGEDYDRHKFNEVADLQLSLRKHKRELAAQLESRQLNQEQFTDELRRALTETALQCEAVLGSRDFVQLFGIEAKHAADLLNPPVR